MAQDAAAGKKVFRKCKSCHSFSVDAKHKSGPNLYDVVGRQAGTSEGYKYSKAMQKTELVWNIATLDEFLANPRGYVKGTKMSFAGLRKKKDRDNIIEYLTQQK